MDKAGQLVAGANFGVFKEPRGFIRLLEFFLAIFAFATTTSHSSYSEFTVTCPGSDVVTQQLPFSYPYRLKDSAKFDTPLCNATKTGSSSPCCNFNSPAEFYVFVGVMAWLYVLAITIFYVLADDKYRENENIPTADFVATAVFTLLWLIGSAAWADGVSHLKTYINPNEMFRLHVPDCQDTDVTCTATQMGNFANLNVTLILGFLCTFVWGGNCWFLFKESRWFTRGGSGDDVPQPQPGQMPPQDQQHI